MKRSLFAPSNKGQAFESPLAQVINNLRNDANQRGSLVSREVSNQVVALEGLSDPAIRGALNVAVEDLTGIIQQATKPFKEYAGLTIAQEEAGIAAGIAAGSVRSYMTRDVSTTALARFANENTHVIGHSGMTGVVDRRAMSMEAFDEKENKNAAIYSVAYNLHAARQDEFGEAFYPTVIVTPDNVGFMMSIRLMYVYDEVRRDVSGSLNNFNRKNVIKAVIDASILRNDQTKIVPVYRKTTPSAATDTDKYFATKAVPSMIMLDGKEIQTAPLGIGKKFSLLGIGSTEAVLATGVLDSTDSVDSSVRLDAIYVAIKGAAADGSADEIVKVTTNQLPLSDFNAAPQGNTRLLQLNFTNESIPFTSKTKKIDGSASTLLSGLGTNTARLSVSVTGSVVQDTGNTQVNASPTEVSRVTDVDGTALGITSGAGKTAADLFIGASVVGYDLIAYRTNSNRRQRGQLIDTQYVNYLYTVPLLPPITALRPVGESEVNDAALLSALITTTHVRTSNAAVTALLEQKAFLSEFVKTKDSMTEAPEVLGVSRYLVDASYLEDVLDTEINLDSLSSAQRTEDLQSLIQNKIRDMAYRLYASSGYKAAADSLYDGAAPKPMLIIGTDQILARYLTLNGDTRLVGETMDYKIVSTQDSRMRGKIVIGFGMESSYNSGVPNPLHFGNMPFKPELTLMMPMVRNGSNVMELTVQPSFRHVNNCPIMGYLEVKNIDKVIASKVDIYTKEQA